MYKSSNFDLRSAKIDMIIIHYTGMESAVEALERLCDTSSKVSAHYLIDENGKLYELVDPVNRAWHAGVSYWRGRESINNNSIGIELVNPGHEFGYRNFPKIQMDVLVRLLQKLIKKYSIPNYNILGHSDIACARKTDPGELFDWKYLYQNNIGLYHDVELMYPVIIEPTIDVITSLQINLMNIGYKIEQTSVLDTQTIKVFEAFKRHFYPEYGINNIIDNNFIDIVTDLLYKVNSLAQN